VKSLLLLIILGLATTVAVEASPTYFFSITAPGAFSASGDLATTGASSPYTISSITGLLGDYTANQGPSSGTTISGGAITGLSTFEAASNTVPLGSTGFSFDDANGDSYNIHLLFPGTYVLSDSLGDLSETSNAILLTLTSVPEATTMALSGLGLLAAAAMIRRKRTANPKA
jgi:hypothetical protein